MCENCYFGTRELQRSYCAWTLCFSTGLPVHTNLSGTLRYSQSGMEERLTFEGLPDYVTVWLFRDVTNCRCAAPLGASLHVSA